MRYPRRMPTPSTSNLQLPPPAKLERLSQSLATLDAILCRDWDSRYYSHNNAWSTDGNRMGSMRNGSGDDYYILFTDAGAAIKGFAHESPLANPGKPPTGVFTGFPSAIQGFLSEPAFTMEDTTFCLWCTSDGRWTTGPIALPERQDTDGSEFLLALLGGAPADYQSYAEGYFEVEIPLAAIESIYAHRPLTGSLLRDLNPGIELGELAQDLAEIGYP